MVPLCGRFALLAHMRQLMEEFGLEDSEMDEVAARYNIAPSQRVLAVVNEGQGNQLVQLRWGLVPHWAKGPRPRYMINARAETVAEKPTFRSALTHRRCLIVADGFYEWRRSGMAKVPMYIRDRSGRLWGFAGIYEHWQSPEGDEVPTCAIITVEANEAMARIHDRMPAIITPGERAIWLDPGVKDPSVLLTLLRPYDAEEMEAFPVGPEVNSPSNDHPGLIRRLDSFTSGG
jgi:putative SOS response-associated peptidase YedK